MSAAENDLGINKGIVELICDKRNITKHVNQKRMDIHIHLNIVMKNHIKE